MVALGVAQQETPRAVLVTHHPQHLHKEIKVVTLARHQTQEREGVAQLPQAQMFPQILAVQVGQANLQRSLGHLPPTLAVVVGGHAAQTPVALVVRVGAAAVVMLAAIMRAAQHQEITQTPVALVLVYHPVLAAVVAVVQLVSVRMELERQAAMVVLV